jgi:hypothetical protein
MKDVEPGWKVPPELQGEQTPEASIKDVERYLAGRD